MSETPSRDHLRDNAMSVAAISSERIESDDNAWTRRLVLFLRIMAVISVAKGLYHWAQVGLHRRRGRSLRKSADGVANRHRLFRGDRTRRRGRAVAGDAMGRGGVADNRRVDGGDRTDVSGNLWRQPDGGPPGSPDAGGLSGAGLDGRARTAAIGVVISDLILRV